MNIIDIVSSMAGFLTTASFVPQAVKVIRTRNTEGISLWMYIIFSAGVACWLTYGIMLHYPPIIIANTITLTLALIILVIKITASSKKDR